MMIALESMFRRMTWEFLFCDVFFPCCNSMNKRIARIEKLYSIERSWAKEVTRTGDKKSLKRYLKACSDAGLQNIVTKDLADNDVDIETPTNKNKNPTITII